VNAILPAPMSLQRAGLFAVVLAALSALSGCTEGRFPVCKSNADCTDKDAGLAGPVCYNLKCVECHYDTDCKPGASCNTQTSECEGLSVTADPPKDGGTGEPTAWDHGTWDSCAADCKDRECIKACDAKFNK
jgi:hypothetical protein